MHNNEGTVDLLVYPVGELATAIVEDGPARRQQMGQIMRIKDAALAIRQGLVIAAGPADYLLSNLKIGKNTKKIAATNKVITPGLIDPHTHLVFAGSRANEFISRCQGKSYKEIALSGGGIVASMNATQAATLTDLVSLSLQRLKRMVAYGTTTCEVKTGYGLSLASELDLLKTIVELSKIQPIELIPTFMPAHAVPPGIERKEYVEEVVSCMLPAAVALFKGTDYQNVSFPFNDVFCDEGYFNLQETRAILTKGLELGLQPKVHADEFRNLGASTLAVELKAVSADHLLNISETEIRLMASSDTVAVLLPGTSFFLNLDRHAPARKMIDQGVAVALGSDYNPGSCHIFALPLIWALACLHLKMTVEEALTALTVNAAYAVGLGHKIGQLKPGYQADFVVFDVSSLEEIPYNLGNNTVAMTFKRGQMVFSANNEGSQN